jgi:gliding motility-associated-like protein
VIILRNICLFFLLLFSFCRINAQCSSTIASFPYLEDFEAGTGGWTAGGNASDWTWGKPSKPVINSAASGTKCWITGGLTNSGYNNNENSTLTSPCYNFTSLSTPYLRFKIFWETEKKYDGATLQYSLDGGSAWTTLGSYADYTSCPSNNWFNTNGISAVGSPGWSGNIQPTAACSGGAGNGSGAWVLAQHEMSSLAGKPSVKFRFVFAAGSVCNNYDGFAIDDIQITEAPAATASFNFLCTGSNTVNFTPSVSGCNPSYTWNFDDPASGSSNLSTSASPSHFYSGPGNYNVTMTATVPGFAPVTVMKPVAILQVDVTVGQVIKCNGDKTGSLSATTTPTGNYQYSWNTSPAQQTPVASGLGKGSYTVTVSGTGACTATESVTLTEPTKLSSLFTATDAYCNKNNGTAKTIVNGGTPPFSYNWSPAIGNSDSIGGLAAGSYQLTVTDANGCTSFQNFPIRNVNDLKIDLGRDTFFCPGQSMVLSPGLFSSYLWQDNSTGSAFRVTETGNYSVTVTNDSGCTATDAIKITVDCRDIFFPTGFTPDKNGRNDGFGALGNLIAVQNYTLKVYNRWGEIVFQTKDPFQKWDGSYLKNEGGTGSFVWIAEYQLSNRQGKFVRKGVVTRIE